MSGDVRCVQCGHRNTGGANFCSSCGAPLGLDDHTMTLTPVDGSPAAEAEVAVAVDDVPAGSAILVVRHGPGTGSRFLLDKDVVTVGRHPDSDIFLDDVTVSRRHAELVRDGDLVLLRDVGSLNGTYLNRERIERDEPLVTGDEVQVGRFRLGFVQVAGDAA